MSGKKWVVLVYHPRMFEIVFIRKFQTYAEADAWGALMERWGFTVELRKLSLEEVSHV